METPTPTLVLAAYGADLISGRRVVVFGNALSGLAEILVERGARLVVVYDEQPMRVSEATARSVNPSISFAPMGPGGIAARDGAFDVGIVECLQTTPEPAKIITRLRRALTARGVGFVCAQNPDVKLPAFDIGSAHPASEQLTTDPALGYYDLYDLVSAEFDEIKMVGQTPFVGYALADFAPEAESEFSIDTAFVPGGAEEAERYVAVCSHFPVSIDPFCVVQLEARTLLPQTAPAPSTAPQLVAVQRQLAEAEIATSNERELRQKHEALLQQAREELQRRDDWVAQLEGRASTADERADAAQSELESAHQQAAETTRKLAQVQQQLQAARAELDSIAAARNDRGVNETALRADLNALNERLTKREEEVHLLRQELTVLSSEQERLEAQLAERGRTLLELQRALRDTETFAATLVVQLEPGDVVDADAALDETSFGVVSTAEVESRFGAIDSRGGLSDNETPHELSEAELESSPWTQLNSDEEDSSPASGPRQSSDGSELHAALQREAEHLAALEATRWTVEELEGKLLAQNKEDFDELLSQLHVAQQQLQRQSVLLAQYAAACEQRGVDLAHGSTPESSTAAD